MKNNEINALYLERRFRRFVVHNSAVCIIAVIACFAAMCLFVNEKNGICQINLDLFENTKTMPVIVDDSFSAKTGGIEFTVEDCTIKSEENMLYVSISGRNVTGEDWSADGSTFAVAVQCMSDPKPREYYYNLTEDWRAASAADGGSFFVMLGFHIDDVEKMNKDGDKFSLVSFRGADCPTSVIVLNGLIRVPD